MKRHGTGLICFDITNYSLRDPDWDIVHRKIGAACRSLTEQEEKWSARFGRLPTSTNRNQL